MPTPRTLRPYQDEAVQSVFNEWGSETRRTAVVLPTGTGKSTVIGKVAAESARMGLRVAMLAHRGELLDQMADTVTAVAPDLPRPGIVRAEHDDSHAQIVAASFQTLTNDYRLQNVGQRQVVLCDETHHVTAASYRRVVESFGPDTFFCGFTATLRREDGKALRDMIDSVAFERNLRWAIGEAYLVRPKGITVKIPELDLGKVKTTAGDFQQTDLAEVMEAETPEIVKAILMHAKDRRPIIFAASVLAAHDIAQLLTESGMAAEAVTGAMSYDDRQPIYSRFRSGETRALVTVQVLTEGADFPMCDAVVIARPTQSQNLYSQMVGRALRLWEDKDDALVLDLVGTSRVLKLVTLTNLDAGTHSRKVDTEGNDLPPEDDEDWGEDALAGITDKPKNRRLGPIDTIGIDLLGPDETGILWLGTVKGVPFVAPQEADWIVFLWETTAGHYRVGTMSKAGEKGGGWLDGGKEMPLEIAKDVAEDYVIDSGYAFPLRTASWRKYQPASEAQLRFARNLGIIGAENMTKARLSDEITIALVSRRLDGSR
jgi:superfamily II DNA or RNA helicase